MMCAQLCDMWNCDCGVGWGKICCVGIETHGVVWLVELLNGVPNVVWNVVVVYA